jgi:ABC-type nickel/cobalt efflux system permease component RcnA
LDAPPDLLLAAVAAALLGALAAWWCARAWRAGRARRRARRAARGEIHAERLLASEGWTVEARQVARTLRFTVDGAPAEARVRCDLVVRRGARRCVAEVKTGALAPRIDHPPTRRQLLEYRLAFDVDGILLVDAEAGRVREIVFPHAAARAPVPWRAYLLAATLGALAAAAALRAW